MNLFSVLLDNEKLLAALQHINPLAVIAAGKLGVIMPLIVSALSQPRFTKPQRTVLSIVSCLAASAIICLASGAFTGLNWAASLVVLLCISWGLYARFYKPTGIAPWFEKATEIAKLAPLVVAVFGSKAATAFDDASRHAAAPDAAPPKVFR